MLIKPGTNADNLLTARLVQDHQEQCDIQTVSREEIGKTEQIVLDGHTKSLLSCSLEASGGTVGRQGSGVGDGVGSRGTIGVGLLVGHGRRGRGTVGLSGLLVGRLWCSVGGLGSIVGGLGRSVGGFIFSTRAEEQVGEDGG